MRRIQNTIPTERYHLSNHQVLLKNVLFFNEFHKQNSKNALKLPLVLNNVRKLSITPTKKCKLHCVKPHSLNIIENAKRVQVEKCSKNMFLGSTVYHVLSKGQHQVFTLISQEGPSTKSKGQREFFVN